jgi:hypothetical protein
MEQLVAAMDQRKATMPATFRKQLKSYSRDLLRHYCSAKEIAIPTSPGQPGAKDKEIYIAAILKRIDEDLLQRAVAARAERK